MRPISKVTFFLLYSIICLIWGSTWFVIHLGNAAALPPFAAAGIRFLIATTLLWSYIAYKKIALPSTKSKWGSIVLVGLLSNALSFGIVYWASFYIPSGLEAVIFGTMPLWTAAIGHYALTDHRLTRTKIFGIIIGLIGIAVIFFPEITHLNPEAFWALLILLIAPLVSGASAVVTKRSTTDVPAVSLNAITTLVGAIALSSMALLFEPIDSISLTAGQLYPILYLAFFGTIVTFGIYFKLIKFTSAVTMSYVSIITPVIAVLLGWLFLDETLGMYEIGGSALVLVGTAISLRM